MIIGAIEEIIEEAERCKGAYFWSPAGNAAGRRSNEKKHNHPTVEWDEGGNHYTARYDYSESCHNVYASGYYTKNGNKTTLTAIRNSLARLKAAAN